MNRPKLTGDIVQHHLEHAAARRTVVFATSIAHSVALAQQFMTHGVSAEHVDANTPQRDREAIFGRFSNGRTQVLTNCTLARHRLSTCRNSTVSCSRGLRSLSDSISKCSDADSAPLRGSMTAWYLITQGMCIATGSPRMTASGPFTASTRSIKRSRQIVAEEQRQKASLRSPAPRVSASGPAAEGALHADSISRRKLEQRLRDREAWSRLVRAGPRKLTEAQRGARSTWSCLDTPNSATTSPATRR